MDRIICDDFLEYAPTLPEKSIPLIIADPPYNIGKAAWDKIDNYLDWCGEWLKAIERVMADNGSFYMFHNDKEVMADLMLWIRENTGFVFKTEITVEKKDPAYVVNRYGNAIKFRNYIQMAEYILFYTFQDETGLSRVYDDRDCFKGIKEYLRAERKKAGLSNDEINRVCGTSTMCNHFWGDAQWQLPTEAIYTKLQTTGFFQREYEDLRREYEDLRYSFDGKLGTTNVWHYYFSGGRLHPTQKPVELIENIIRHSSNEGDLVLDPFAGVGTTAIAALRTGRHYLCVDKERKYCDIAERQIREYHEENKQMDIFDQAAGD